MIEGNECVAHEVLYLVCGLSTRIISSFSKFAGTQLIGILSFTRFSYLIVCIIILLSYQKGEELGLYLICFFFSHPYIMLDGVLIQILKGLCMISLL